MHTPQQQSETGVEQNRERWEELAADLVAEAAATSDATARRECLREAAAMYERQLGDRPQALAAWLAALAADPAQDEVALAIERNAEALGAWPAVLDECQSLLKEIDEPVARAALLVWLARWEERFGGEPRNVETRLLEASALAPGRAAVAEALGTYYSARGEWEEAAEVLEKGGLANGDPDEAVGLLVEAARIAHSHLNDPARATQLYARVLELSPKNALAAEGLAELAAAAADPAVMCTQYRKAHELDPDNLGIIREWAQVAFAHERWQDVRYLFDRLYARAGGGAGAQTDTRARLNEALDRFVAGKKWPEAIDVLKTLARDTAGVVRAKYYLAAGKIAEHELKDEDAAVELYNLALDTNPEDTKTLERLYAILSAKRAWGRAESDLRRLIDRVAATDGHDAKLLASLWRRLGDLYRLGLRDLGAAAQAYEQCARLDPSEQRYLKLVSELLQRHQTVPAAPPSRAGAANAPRTTPVEPSRAPAPAPAPSRAPSPPSSAAPFPLARN